MAKATKENNTLHPKRGAFPTPRNVLADATPYEPGAGNMGTPGTPPPPSGSTGAGSQSGAGNVGTPGTPPPPSGSAGAGLQGGASNVGTPGTPEEFRKQPNRRSGKKSS